MKKENVVWKFKTEKELQNEIASLFKNGVTTVRAADKLQKKLAYEILHVEADLQTGAIEGDVSFIKNLKNEINARRKQFLALSFLRDELSNPI